MALNMIPIPPDASRDAKARDLLAEMHLWHTGTLKQQWGAFEPGTAYFITLSGHRCNAVFCSCPDYRRGHICKHVRAVVMADAERTTRFVKRIEELIPTCKETGCQDDPEPRSEYCWRHLTADVF